MPQTGFDHQRLLKLRRELWARACRRDLLAFATEALAPKGEAPAAHHRRICSELETVARGEVPRLMLLLPPGAGRTTYTSKLFPAWYFATRPDTNIIAASHTAELAETSSGYVQLLHPRQLRCPEQWATQRQQRKLGDQQRAALGSGNPLAP